LGFAVVSRNLKLTIAYDGTRFVGWQKQASGESIQGLIEAALSQLEGAPVVAHGAGRTDAGVHAEAQVASAAVAFAHDPIVVLRALNGMLPPDIRITAVAQAPPDFHARFSARGKTYRYQIDNRSVADPFTRAFAWHVSQPLDVSAMQAAATALIGTHDFAGFQSTGSDVSTTVRTVTRSELALRAGLTVYEVEADGFLRHMVRAVVGTLVEIGRGWRAVEGVAAVLQGKSRAEAGATAPAHGLVLVKVEY
jgi:tRNA pseudouridine38-40 synthase